MNQKKKQPLWDNDVVQCLFQLQSRLSNWVTKLDIRTEHRRPDGEDMHLFRAHPGYRGGDPWNDWVTVNWGHDGESPCEIWCFIDLTMLPTNEALPVVMGTPIKRGVYALVESAGLIPQELDNNRNTDLFTRITKEYDAPDNEGDLPKRKLYLADVKAFLEPICVVPDIDRDQQCNYFLVAPRDSWAGQFTDWLEAPHRHDDMVELEEVEAESEEDTEEESE